MATSPRHFTAPQALPSSPSTRDSDKLGATPPLVRSAAKSTNQHHHPMAKKRLKLDSAADNFPLTPTPPLPSDTPNEAEAAKLELNVCCNVSLSIPIQSPPTTAVAHSSISSVEDDDAFIDGVLSRSSDTLLGSQSTASTKSVEMDEKFVDDVLSQSGDDLLDVTVCSTVAPVIQSPPTKHSSSSLSQALNSTPLSTSLEGYSQSPLNISSPQVVPYQSTSVSLISSPICVVPESSETVSPCSVKVMESPCRQSLASPRVTISSEVPPSSLKIAIPSPCSTKMHRMPQSSHVKPSPAISVASTKSVEVDDLFDDLVSTSGERLLDEAIFSDGTAHSDMNRPTAAQGRMDGATMQVLAAQEKMEEEKHKLLCSIQALKNELAAKNEKIQEFQDDKKNVEEGIVSSMTEEFTCVICQELFISAHTLPCSHSFCKLCIMEWMKTNRVCPICRKQVISGPVHSLVLDNAISKIEEKLSGNEREEREKTKKDRECKKSAASNTVTGTDVIVIGSSPASMSGEETSDYDSESDSDSSPYFTAHSGYGGYGRCFHCGKCAYL